MPSYQCYNHRGINDPTGNVSEGRDSTQDKTYFGSGALRIRFHRSDGTGIFTTTFVVYQCSTSTSRLYSGEVPITPAATSNGTICLLWSSGSCTYKHHTKVTNRVSYYVYFLSSPSLNGLRYRATNSTTNIVASR